MAYDSLKDPVRVSAIGISASSLPIGINPAYQQYILSQATDFTNVAWKANEAGQGAYDAQVKNEEQDVKITANTNAINLLEVRITTAEGKIVVIRSDVDYLLDEVIDIQADIVSILTDVGNLQASITDIQNDYVSKTVTTLQSLASPINVTTSYSVDGTKVIGPRQTGWTAGTGTALLGAFNASQTYTVSATYTQSEVSSMRTGKSSRRI